MSNNDILNSILGGTEEVKPQGKIQKTSEKETFAIIKLNEIAVIDQVRLELDEENLENITASIKQRGLDQKCEVRHFFNDEERLKIQEKFPNAKYVLVFGHHRFEGLHRNKYEEYSFIIAKKAKYKNTADVVSAQLSENMTRKDMVVYDIASGIGRILKDMPDLGYNELSQQLTIKKTYITKYVTIDRNITPEIRGKLNELNVSGLNTLYNISKMIEEGLDWLGLLQQYATQDGVFHASKITESLTNRIRADLKAEKNPKPTEVLDEPNSAVEVEGSITPTSFSEDLSVEPKHKVDFNVPPSNNVPSLGLDAPTDKIIEFLDENGDLADKTLEKEEAKDAQDAIDSLSKGNKGKDKSNKLIDQEEIRKELKEAVANSRVDPKVSNTLDAFSDEEIGFMRGVAFVLSKDPDTTAKQIAEMLKTRGFGLDDVGEETLYSLISAL
jgi:hypothetical protein